MTKLPAQFIEDKALRDAAKDVFTADIAHAKVNFSGKGIATRIGGRIGDGAKDVVEVAKVHADDNRGILAIIIGALVLWFARSPIKEILGHGEAEAEELEDNIDASDTMADSDAELAGAEHPAAASTGDNNE